VLSWSKWSSLDKYTDFKTEPGVYRIRLAYNQSQRPFVVSRLMGKDEEGLLSIGHSVNLRNRIQSFYRVAEQHKGFLKHSGGDRLFLARICASASSNTFFNDKRLQVSVVILADKDKAKVLEERLLKRYFVKHGELPPLNNSMPDGNVKWDDILLNQPE
jgi:hypothetical protein